MNKMVTLCLIERNSTPCVDSGSITEYSQREEMYRDSVASRASFFWMADVLSVELSDK